MTSEFDEFMSGGFSEAQEVFGTKQFTIGDAPPFSGSFSSLGVEAYSTVIGGVEMPVRLSVSCALAQFGGNIPKNETRIKVGTVRYIIASSELTESSQSVTFQLAEPNSK